MNVSKAARLLGFALACAAGAPQANAQVLDLSPQTSPVVGIASTMTGVAAMSHYTRPHGADLARSFSEALAGPSGQGERPMPSPAALRRLRFVPSPAITRQVDDRFIADVGAKLPQRTAEVRKLFDSGVLERTFAELLGKFGYSPNDLADVMTAYIILSWETVHDGDATRYPQGIEAVHRRLRRALADSPGVGGFSDAQKQEFAETLADQAMISTIARKQLIAQNDTARLRQLERGVRDATLQLGVDVGRLELTNRGFVAAR